MNVPDARTVVPLVTRWFSANGADTYQLEKGKPATVPANLAKWLIAVKYAEAV
jgi:hypothetical protein